LSIFRRRVTLLGHMIWKPATILRELRRLYKSGADLSYNNLARRNQALLSAAAYHFNGYRRAVEQAGIDYADVLRRPRWTKLRIIAEIKKARRSGKTLHWSAVTRRRDMLRKAAFAALQRRLFGSWDKALIAAGLDADEVSPYRRWSRTEIVYELRSRRREGTALNSGALQRQSPSLHAAAVRYFGTLDGALAAAGIDAASTRLRRNWTKLKVLAALKAAGKSNRKLSDGQARRKFPALHGAAVRLFGAFTTARAAAGVAGPRSGKS
jgi:hypothetical protein